MDVKELTNEIQSAVKELRDTNEKMEAEKKEWGSATALFEEQMAKQNSRIDELEAKLHKTGIVKPGEAEEAKKSAHTKAFFKWMRSGKSALEPDERKALVQDTTGLYLVPEELEQEIIRAIPSLNFFRQIAPARTITRDKIRVRSLTEVSMGWGKLETGTEIPDSTVTPSEAYIYAEDLYGLTKIGEDELMDVDANLAAIIADSFSQARAEAEEEAFAVGSGHSSSEPDGVAVDSDIIASYKTNWSTADTVLFDDFITCFYGLGAQYRQNGVWLMNSQTEAAARKLRAEVASGYYGNYLWEPSLQAGTPNRILGKPVYNNDSMNYPADATAGINVIFGDFQRGYRIVDRAGLAVQRLNELYAEAGLVGFKAHFRVGGGVIRPAAFYGIYNNT